MKTYLKRFIPVLLTVGVLFSAERSAGQSKAPDAAAIQSAAEDFHRALAEGAPDRVMALLQPDALIVEGGAVQTRGEYQSEHLGEDIAYAKAIPGKPLTVVVAQEGDVGWVTSTFRVTGKFEDKPVDSLAAETMVLTRTGEGWRIRTIHWSSHKASKN